MWAAWKRPLRWKSQSIDSARISSSIHSSAVAPSARIALARSAPWREASSSAEGFTLVLIWPPLRVLQPQPARSASRTSVLRPARAVTSAALSPV